jgi:hypothetical protein
VSVSSGVAEPLTLRFAGCRHDSRVSGRRVTAFADLLYLAFLHRENGGNTYSGSALRRPQPRKPGRLPQGGSRAAVSAARRERSRRVPGDPDNHESRNSGTPNSRDAKLPASPNSPNYRQRRKHLRWFRPTKGAAPQAEESLVGRNPRSGFRRTPQAIARSPEDSCQSPIVKIPRRQEFEAAVNGGNTSGGSALRRAQPRKPRSLP